MGVWAEVRLGGGLVSFGDRVHFRGRGFEQGRVMGEEANASSLADKGEDDNIRIDK